VPDPSATTEVSITALFKPSVCPLHVPPEITEVPVLREYLKKTVDPGGASVTVTLFDCPATLGSRPKRIGSSRGGGGLPAANTAAILVEAA
jgi:hypothetical protein